MGIYVVSHKDVKNDFPDGYKSIIVNANKNNAKGDLYDNVGDNISYKNGSYCELTAIYWLWKNNDDDYVGIDHYRRFFLNKGSLLKNSDAIFMLDKDRVILPQKEKFTKKMSTLYWSTCGYKEDLKVMRNAIIKLTPDYLEDFDAFFKQNEMYCYNMSFMSRQNYNRYCAWLFPILQEIENTLDRNSNGEANRKGYYKRIYGFMSERLLNVYISHNDISVIELPVKFIGKKPTLGQHILTKVGKMKDKFLR